MELGPWEVISVDRKETPERSLARPPREAAGSAWPSVDREVGSQHTLNLRVPSSWTSSLQTCEKSVSVTCEPPILWCFCYSGPSGLRLLINNRKSGLNGVCGSKCVVCKSVHFCITLGKLLHFFVPQFSHQKKIGLLIELCVVLRIKYYSWNIKKKKKPRCVTYK